MHDLEVGPRSASTPTPVAPPGAAGIDRAAVFAQHPETIPRKAVFVFVASVVVLALGGVMADHFFSGSAGTPATLSTTGAFPPPLVTSATPKATGSAGAAPASPLPASLSAMMALEPVAARPAPGFSLTDQDGGGVSLASLRGKVVVLSFFDAACDDICPVLASELARAAADLGPDMARVELVTVNTDPLDLTVAPARWEAAGVSSTMHWHFLTGSLHRLDSVWKSYGVTVEVERTTHLVSHRDVMYFIDPSGRLRLRATPFADESRSGTFSAPPRTEAAWASGIADQARSLLPSAR